MSDPIVSIPDASVEIGKGFQEFPIITQESWLNYFQDITEETECQSVGWISPVVALCEG